MDLTLTPIGVIHTNLRVRFDAPHQPANAVDERNVVELFPDRRFEQALQDLEGFDRIWLIWWSDRNGSWQHPLVLPPRGSAKRRGVFATRSPHRPNPICMTAVPLIEISGLKLIVGNCDLLDGTPILDIKPYLPGIDSFPEAKSGWVTEIENELAAAPRYTVTLSTLANDQLAWLKSTWNINFIEKAIALLEQDPTRHRSRRISRYGADKFRLGCGPWRVIFSLDQDRILIEEIARGYPERALHVEDALEHVPDRDAQVEFGKHWPT